MSRIIYHFALFFFFGGGGFLSLSYLFQPLDSGFILQMNQGVSRVEYIHITASTGFTPGGIGQSGAGPPTPTCTLHILGRYHGLSRAHPHLSGVARHAAGPACI